MLKHLKKLRPKASGEGIGPSSSTISGHSHICELRLSVETKQRFIDATKSLLEIANESTDAFPPLKSCVGGIHALVQYYEVRLRLIAHDPANTSIPGMQRC